MSSFRLIALCLVFGCALGTHAAAATAQEVAALAQVTEQFRSYYLDDPFAMKDNNEALPNVTTALEDSRSLLQDGSWSDVKYLSTARSGWEPSIHYNRMLAMTLAAQAKATSAADRTQLLTAVHAAFGFWIAHDFQCPNWWYNKIGTPKSIATTAVLLGLNLTPAEFTYVTGTLLARYPIDMTGQNRIWLSGNELMRGLLLRDPAMVALSASTVWNEIQVTTEEGLQADASFHQHGPQQQMGNYGMAFAVEECRLALILRDSPWAMPPAKLSLYRDYVLNGENWIAWRGAFDISALDRQMMPRAAHNRTRTLVRVMELSAVMDPAHAAAYRAFGPRQQPGAPNDLIGDRFFWRSDYYIHRTAGFAATLKMSSHRVIGEETVNTENLSGYHAADGALYLYASGQEYEDIFPVWDWSRLPGVTCVMGEPKRFRTSQMPTDFAGGIADGTEGLAALDGARDGVTAHKAWFFGSDFIACLGSAISGPAGAETATTLNQSLLHGAVTVHAGRSTTMIPGGSERTLKSPDWVEHDGWRYTLLTQTTLQMSSLRVTGSWSKVFTNPDTPTMPVDDDVFLLSINHGEAPSAASYAYAAGPIDSVPSVKVLANSKDLQAVALEAGRYGLVFWAAGSFQLPDGRTLKVTVPGLVWVNGSRILVADPTQKLKAFALSVNGTEKTLALPTGQMAGTAVGF